MNESAERDRIVEAMLQGIRDMVAFEKDENIGARVTVLEDEAQEGATPIKGTMLGLNGVVAR
jgi:hypothetical protein